MTLYSALARRKLASKFLFVGLLVLATCIAGCGNNTNNDQGNAFLALGFFDDGTGTSGDNGTIVYLNSDFFGGQGVVPPFVPVDKDPTTPQLEGGYLGLQNLLTSQFIRVVRIDCDYQVQGADPLLGPIPSDSYAVGFVIEAAPSADSGEEAAGTSTAYLQFLIVSSDILQYLSVNQNLLPALPYRMVATCRAVGVSEGGDVFTTNDVNYTIIFSERPEASTGNITSDALAGGVGFQTGPGTGGDPSTVVASSSSSSS